MAGVYLSYVHWYKGKARPGYIYGQNIERLKHDFSHLVPIGNGVQWRLSQHHRVLLRHDTELIVGLVEPNYPLHVLTNRARLVTSR